MARQSNLTTKIVDSILNDYIRNGAVSVGGRLPTVVELQRIYGVSLGTITHSLGVLAERDIINKRQGSGCYVSDIAQAKPISASLVGFFQPGSMKSEIVIGCMRGVQNICARTGHHLILGSNGTHSYHSEKAEIQRMVDVGCKAIVLYPASRTQEQLQSDYLAQEFKDVSIVLIDIAYSEQKRPHVIFDNTRLGTEMTQLLVGYGHRKIAFMMLEEHSGTLKHRSTLDRYQGYLDAARENDIIEQHWLVPTANISDLEPYLVQWLTAWKEQDPQTRPSAVITLHDPIAIVLSSMAQEMGIAVPGDLEFVGFDNHPISRSFYPRFATSNPDFVRAGEIATELALRYAREGKSENLGYVLPAPIVGKHSPSLMAPSPERDVPQSILISPQKILPASASCIGGV